MKKKLAIACAAISAAAFLAGCASPNYYGQGSAPAYPLASPAYPAPASYSNSYGTIDSIRVSQSAAAGSGTGAVVGALVGGLLGNQVGGGNGRTAATIAGVLGGAMMGDRLEQRNAQPREVYQVGVRLDSGGYQTVTEDSAAGLQVGNRVRIENDRVYRY